MPGAINHSHFSVRVDVVPQHSIAALVWLFTSPSNEAGDHRIQPTQSTASAKSFRSPTTDSF